VKAQRIGKTGEGRREKKGEEEEAMGGAEAESNYDYLSEN